MPFNNPQYFFANSSIISKPYIAHSDHTLDTILDNNTTDCNLFIFNNRYDIDHYVLWDNDGYSIFDPAYYENNINEPPALEDIPILITSRDNGRLLYTRLQNI